jgi:hypothetical protein
MKRIATLSFALLYLFLITGIIVNIHYCLGEIASVSLFSKGDPCCCGDRDMADGCCDDQQLVLQFDTDEQKIELKIFDFSIAVVGEILAPQTSVSHSIDAKNPVRDCTDPPPKIPLWLKHSNLTFYG